MKQSGEKKKKLLIFIIILKSANISNCSIRNSGKKKKGERMMQQFTLYSPQSLMERIAEVMNL